MDIIIRNANRDTIIKAEQIRYMQHPTQGQFVEIIAINGGMLCRYQTKERCVEIVNDIYNEVIQRATDGDSVVIYSMPKE